MARAIPGRVVTRLALWTASILAVLALIVGTQAYIGKLRRDLVQARAETTAAREALDASENTRDREAKAATASFEGLQETCGKLAVAGIQKGRTIERIVSTPAPASGGRGGIIGGIELRGLVGQEDATPAPPPTVRPGADSGNSGRPAHP